MSDILSASTDAESLIVLDEIEQFAISEKTEEKTKRVSFIKNTLTKIDTLDKKISNYIHILELNIILENIIYIFGRLFNPDIMIIFYLSVLFYQMIINKNYFYIIKPLIHLTVALILTLILKYSFKRPRPEINSKVKRLHNLRIKEKNFSMPSGDSMQAANFAIVALFYFHISFLGFLIIPFVMFARIFYFCHYFFDTLVGALIGGGISLGLVFPLKKLNM